MIDQKLFESVCFLLEEAEEKVWRKAERIMLHLYWHLGYCLREYSEEEVAYIAKELALVLQIEEDMFTTAYTFYKENPLKKKIVRSVL